MRRSNIDSPAPRRPGLRTLWGRAKSIMKSIRHWLSVRYAVSRGVGTGSRARRGSALYAGGRLASLSVRFPDPRSLCRLASLDCPPVTARPDRRSRPRASGAESSSRSLRGPRVPISRIDSYTGGTIHEHSNKVTVKKTSKK